MLRAQRGEVVADAMVRAPVLHGPALTLAQARAALGDRHRHLLLLVEDGLLLGTLSRADLDEAPPYDGPAAPLARLEGRTVGADEPLAGVLAQMRARGERRRAVVDGDGVLLGLLCLKASGSGFCSDAGIAARAADRRAPHAP